MVLSMDRFVGKVAVVTGASAGIGAATVEELVKSGVIVAGLARRVDKLEELATKLSKEKGELHPFKCDLTKEEEIISTIRNVIEQLGDIHILINNAGLKQPTDLINGNTEMWKVTLDTNILGLCVATREVIQNMKAKGTQGHIIHVNSLSGHRVPAMPRGNVYPATKHAVTALAETLRLDINRDKLPIKVTSLSPGFVISEFQAVAGMPANIPIPPLYPPDVAEAVIYVLSTPPHVNVKELMIQAVGS